MSGIRERLFMPGTEEARLVQKLGDQAYDSMARDASMLGQEVQRLASIRGIDPKYLIYLLVHQPDTWNPLVGRARNALQRAIDLAVDRDNDLRFEGFEVPPPSKEPDVEWALGKLGRWAQFEFVPKMAKTYTSVLREMVPETRAVIEESFGESASANEAYLWLHETFKDTLDRKAFNFYKRMWWALILPEFE